MTSSGLWTGGVRAVVERSVDGACGTTAWVDGCSSGSSTRGERDKCHDDGNDGGGGGDNGTTRKIAYNNIKNIYNISFIF